MRIHKATEYALRAVQLIAGKPGRVLSAPKAARETQVPDRFLAKILRRLARAGILRSTPGAAGGFTLARPASAVSVWDVVAAVEDDPRLNVCVGACGECERMETCGIQPVFARAQAAMEAELKRTTLDEAVRLTNALRTWPKTPRGEGESGRPPAAGASAALPPPTRAAGAP